MAASAAATGAGLLECAERGVKKKLGDGEIDAMVEAWIAEDLLLEYRIGAIADENTRDTDKKLAGGGEM